MKKTILIICFLTFLVTLRAQNMNAVLFKVGNDAVTASEFIKTFNKNNTFSKATEKELQDYLDLYISFMLKVKDGIDSKIDTSATFQRELANYRKQSAQPYLLDKEVTEKLITEAMSRVGTMAHASHILILCDPSASPKDTLIAYNKALDIRKKIISGEIDFEEAALKYSEDPSARDEKSKNGKMRPGNRGDLGYFTAFDLIYPFESAVFNTPIGEYSMPARSKYGYHIIYVHDKTPLVTQIAVAQIMLLDTVARFGRMSPKVKAKLDKIEEALKNGEDFGTLAEQYTDEPTSKKKGGVIEPFTPYKRPGDYVKTCISLEKGEISKPFPSQIGWHIVKLIDITAPETPKEEELRSNVISKIQKDSRSNKSVESLILKLKNEYKYAEKDKNKTFKLLLEELNKTNKIPSEKELFAIPGISKVKNMATYANQKISTSDFITYLGHYEGVDLNNKAQKFLNEQYNNFIKEHILNYELEHLENKYPEFKELMKEYHHGMILFDMNNERVWSESLKDNDIVEAFYEKNKQNYLDNTGNVKPFQEVKSVVLTDYQDKLENEWLNRLKKKYPVWIDEDLFQSILKNR